MIHYITFSLSLYLSLSLVFGPPLCCGHRTHDHSSSWKLFSAPIPFLEIVQCSNSLFCRWPFSCKASSGNG